MSTRKLKLIKPYFNLYQFLKVYLAGSFVTIIYFLFDLFYCITVYGKADPLLHEIISTVIITVGVLLMGGSFYIYDGTPESTERFMIQRMREMPLPTVLIAWLHPLEIREFVIKDSIERLKNDIDEYGVLTAKKMLWHDVVDSYREYFRVI